MLIIIISLCVRRCTKCDGNLIMYLHYIIYDTRQKRTKAIHSYAHRIRIINIKTVWTYEHMKGKG